MNKTKLKRSPLFYVGDKYKLIEEVGKYFPTDINTFIEPFVGGGTVFLNTVASKYILNDIDKNVIDLHEFLIKQSKNPSSFFKKIKEVVKRYNLSRSYLEDIVPYQLKKRWKKTYYAKYNKVGYEKMRNNYNKVKKKNPLFLYLLLIYGFNRMLRFNERGYFNIPVGNVDFNKNVVNALNDYFTFVKDRKIRLYCLDFRDFFKKIAFTKNDFIYIDPPYLISSSEYNKLWKVNDEKELLNILNDLNRKKIRFALSNLTTYKNRKNKILINWMRKFNVHKIESNYISYHNNLRKKLEEVLITNYTK